jgi:hypothetical protein
MGTHARKRDNKLLRAWVGGASYGEGLYYNVDIGDFICGGGEWGREECSGGGGEQGGTF